MHARKQIDADGWHGVKFAWTAAELLMLTPAQHRAFATATSQCQRDDGIDALLRPGVVEALFRLACQPWWDPRIARIAEEPGPMPHA